MKAGYQILDLKGKEIKTAGTVIPGAYETIEGSEVPIVVTGINDETLGEIKPRYVAFDVSGTDYVGYLNPGYTITVDDDDKVVIAEVV